MVEKTKTVMGQVELTAGQVKIINGKVDPERTLTSGSLGVYVFRPTDARGRPTDEFTWTVIPWAQVRFLHLDL